jgi:hypothetical protein
MLKGAPISWKAIQARYLITAILYISALAYLFFICESHEFHTTAEKKLLTNTYGSSTVASKLDLEHRRCAITFFGLPRSFRDLVLPSILLNIIRPNIRYKCDYFLHTYNVTFEKESRTGSGGAIYPNDVFELRQALTSEAKRANASFQPRVSFEIESMENFESTHSVLLSQIRENSTKRRNRFWGNDKTFTIDTYVNIIKMWHSIMNAWYIMKNYSILHSINYERVAMLRADVIFVTPLDVFQLAPKEDKSDSTSIFRPQQSTPIFDKFNNESTIPAFAKFPVNDRMFVGPFDATEIWATGRFDRIHEFVRKRPLHSEQFLRRKVLPFIRAKGIAIGMDPYICFLRARCDGTVLHDCGGSEALIYLEEVLNLTCTVIHGKFIKFKCSSKNQNSFL